jgi:hypothetical protein
MLFYAPAEWKQQNMPAPMLRHKFYSSKRKPPIPVVKPEFKVFVKAIAKMLPAPLGVGRTEKLNIYMLLKICDYWDTSMVQCIYKNANEHTEEFSVAAVLLWYASVDVAIREWATTVQLLFLPLNEWHVELKTFLDHVRAHGSVGDTPHGVAVAVGIRKLTTMVGRTLKEADWRQERHEIECNWRHKVAGYSPNRMNAAIWWEWATEEMNAIATTIVGQVSKKGTMATMKDWWSQRVLWAPMGSSSERHRLDEVQQQLHGNRNTERPKKKTVWNNISWEELGEKLKERTYSVARVSTKPEPGRKQRALYANDDWSTIVASYASQDIEKTMNVGGMVSRQTPNDVIDWMRAGLHDGRQGRECWVSLDYKDFNKEHSKMLLAALNIALCKAWMRTNIVPMIKHQKAAAALLVATQHLNGFIEWSDIKENRRALSGLWSGHRDTARDNTMLHYVYHKVAIKQLYVWKVSHEIPRYIGMCGDDEDALFASWKNAVAYLLVHYIMGHVLNPIKQQIGYDYHEFLQRQAVRGSLPVRPLPPMIAAMATGNWYKESGHWYDAAIAAMTSQCDELVSRGMDINAAGRLACVFLDNYMRIPPNKDRKTIELEWWKYRKMGGPSLIWDNINDHDIDVPRIEDIKLKLPSKKVPSRGVADLITHRWRWYKHCDDEELGRLQSEISKEVNMSLFSKRLEQERLSYAEHNMDRRKWHQTVKRFVEKQNPPTPNYEEVIADIWPDKGKRRPYNIEAALQRIGMDIRLFNAIGGWKTLANKGRPKDIAMYENQKPVAMNRQQTTIKRSNKMLDSALQNWLLTNNTKMNMKFPD